MSKQDQILIHDLWFRYKRDHIEIRSWSDLICDPDTHETRFDLRRNELLSWFKIYDLETCEIIFDLGQNEIRSWSDIICDPDAREIISYLGRNKIRSWSTTVRSYLIYIEMRSDLDPIIFVIQLHVRSDQIKGKTRSNLDSRSVIQIHAKGFLDFTYLFILVGWAYWLRVILST